MTVDLDLPDLDVEGLSSYADWVRALAAAARSWSGTLLRDAGRVVVLVPEEVLSRLEAEVGEDLLTALGVDVTFNPVLEPDVVAVGRGPVLRRVPVPDPALGLPPGLVSAYQLLRAEPWHLSARDASDEALLAAALPAPAQEVFAVLLADASCSRSLSLPDVRLLALRACS